MRLSSVVLVIAGIIAADYVVDDGLAIRQIGVTNLVIYGSLSLLIIWLLQYRVVTRIGRKSVAFYQRKSVELARRRSSMKLMRRRSVEIEVPLPPSLSIRRPDPDVP